MNIINTPVLVLDRSYMPLNIVPAKKAIKYVINEKATVVENSTGKVLNSNNEEWSIPSIIKIQNFLGQRSFSKIKVRFNKKTLMDRDRGKCQYCGRILNRDEATIDHVIPKGGVHSGRTSWNNCVIACQPCNHRKGNRTPEQAKMPLSTKPKYPNYMTHLSRILEKHIKDQESWKQYFIL